MRCSLGVVLGLVVACGGGDGGPTGEETSACREGQCLGGLRCLSELCVDPDWDAPVDDGGASTGADSASSSADGVSSDAGSNGSSEEGTAVPLDNVAACEALLGSLACEAPGGMPALNCSVFEAHSCDVTGYFECLGEQARCATGVLDVSQWSGCGPLLECD